MTASWEQQQRPPARFRLLVPAVLVVVGFLAGVMLLPAESRPEVAVVPGDDTVAPEPIIGVDTAAEAADAGGRWTVGDSGPLSARDGAAVAAAGDEVVVWGGRALGAAGYPADGALYEAATDSWRPLPPAPIRGRRDAAAVWTGDEVVIWGGATAGGALADGAALDVASGRWRRLSPAPLSPRRNAHAVWTRGHVVVWGGRRDQPPFRPTDGAAYDPRSDTWEQIPAGPFTRRHAATATAAATDDGMFVWASSGDEARTALYDPAARRWRMLNTPRLDPGRPHAFTSVDGNVLAWGRATIGDRGPLALTFTTSPDWWATVARPPLTPEPGQQLVGGEGRAAAWSGRGPGLVFDALGNRWEAMAGAPRPAAVGWPAQVWVDGRLFVWHQLAAPDAERRTVVWEPSSPWRVVGGSPVPIANRATTLWTGWLQHQQQVVLWGGVVDGATSAGAGYDPELGLWETMPPAPLPPRVNHAAVYTGTRMIVLGGRTPRGDPLQDAAAYVPQRREWERLPDVPVPVQGRAAAWSGAGLYVAGEQGGRLRVASFEPGDEQWRVLPPPPTAGASGRHHVVWTGFEVWVWTTRATTTGVGAAWDPVSGRWRRLPPLPGVFDHAALSWSGSRLYVVDQTGTTRSLGRGTDGWRMHPDSPVAGRSLVLAWSGRRLVAYDPTTTRMASVDPRGGAWAETIPPPLDPADSGALLWTGRHLFVFAGGDVAMQGGLQD